jgi:hypothetical protein
MNLMMYTVYICFFKSSEEREPFDIYAIALYVDHFARFDPKIPAAQNWHFLTKFVQKNANFAPQVFSFWYSATRRRTRQVCARFLPRLRPFPKPAPIISSESNAIAQTPKVGTGIETAADASNCPPRTS